MPREYCIANARMVTADAVIEGHLCVRDGRIHALEAGAPPISRGVAVEDWGGDYLLPGLVELHTDNLEKHLMPRPKVIWPSARAAFLAHDAQMAAAGITTVYDSVCIGETQDKGRYLMLRMAVDAFTACTSGNPADTGVRTEHRLHFGQSRRHGRADRTPPASALRT